jgi:hypothetical protein
LKVISFVKYLPAVFYSSLFNASTKASTTFFANLLSVLLFILFISWFILIIEKIAGMFQHIEKTKRALLTPKHYQHPLLTCYEEVTYCLWMFFLRIGGITSSPMTFTSEMAKAIAHGYNVSGDKEHNH